MKRRDFLSLTATAGLGVLMAEMANQPLAGQTTQETGEKKMAPAFEQPKLPYGLGDLAPFLSEEQMSYHYGKHHAAYFKNLNGLVENKPEAKMTLEEIILNSEGGLFNNAAQAWNHTFFWNCMSPKGGGEPKGKLAEAVVRRFGSYSGFAEEFMAAAGKLFGSGWLWLAADGAGELELMPLSNADLPMKHGRKALLTIDVWEHAYYVDYRNERPRFIAGFMEKINWPFAEKNYA